MSAKVTGGADLQRFLTEAAANLEAKVARGALRAGAGVIAGIAQGKCRSEEVAETIGVSSTRVDKAGVASVKVQTKGKDAFKAPWLENGTDPHFISVDEETAGGRTVRRINRLDKAARREGKPGPGWSLEINGKFVGETVHHPGAEPHPFMRPALDEGEEVAIAAMSSYIAEKTTKEELTGPAPMIEDTDE